VLGSYAPFAGKIDEVRISSRAIRFGTGTLRLDLQESRTAFFRMEKKAQLRLKVINGADEKVKGASLRVACEGTSQSIDLPALKPRQETVIQVPVNTRLRAGRYPLSILAYDAGGKPLGDPAGVDLTIVPRELPHQMPVVMWGTPDSLREMKDIGFNYSLVTVPHVFADTRAAGKAQDRRHDPDWQLLRRQLDQMMAMGLHAAPILSPGGWAANQKQFDRIDHDGKPYHPANVCGLFDRIQDFCRDVGATVALSLGDMPAFKAALINTEARATQLCFHDIDKAAYKQFSGQDIPANVTSARGLLYRNLSNFPPGRIIPDNDPILNYLRWFWKQGDGWNKLDTLVSQGIHSTGRQDLWTWFDPANQAPSVWGSGGKVDAISQWTYTNPNPIKVGFACDELFAMAGGRPGQQVMNMIQIIWYRSRSAPMPGKGRKPVAAPAEWEKKCPDARFISIPPDHLSEGMWLELARPIKGIMNHGWGSLGSKLGYQQTGYTTTNVQTRQRHSEMLHKVVMPQGPMLMQVPDRPSDVGFLESFASQMLAARMPYRWESTAYMIVRFAALQPRILYAETIEKEGLDQYKVLVLPVCDVLTQSVADAIRKFQARGGIVIGDELLAPGIQSDILLQRYDRTGHPLRDKAVLLERAAKLRKDLGSYYTRVADSSDPEVIVRLRRYEDSDYLFAVNDHRTFGDYVGQHKLVMEKGVHARATLTLNRPTGFVYDLTESREVTDIHKANDRLSFESDLSPGQGRLFLVTSRPIGQVRIAGPQQAATGDAITCEISITDDAGQDIDAVVPLHVQITDAQGKPAEYSGYYGAANGKITLKLDVPANAARGVWKIQAQELASGRSGFAKLTIH
jgi:hypothetical protein